MSEVGQVHEEVLRAGELVAERTRRQSELAAQFQAEHGTLRRTLRIKEGAAVRDGFLQRIRRWYIEYRDVNGKFPDLPPEDEGGSKAIYDTPDVPAEPVTGTSAPTAVKKVRDVGIPHRYITNRFHLLLCFLRQGTRFPFD